MFRPLFFELIPVVAAVAGVVGCGSSPTAPSPTTLAVSQANVSLSRTETSQVSVTSTRLGVTTDITTAATWRSSNEQVATVAAGLITAVGPGTATITVEQGGAMETVAVVVRRRVYLRSAVTVTQTPRRSVRGGIGGLSVSIDGLGVGDRGYSGHGYERSADIGDDAFEHVVLEPGEHELMVRIGTFNGDDLDTYTFTIEFHDPTTIVDVDTGEQIDTLHLETRTDTFGENPDARWTFSVSAYTS